MRPKGTCYNTSANVAVFVCIFIHVLCTLFCTVPCAPLHRLTHVVLDRGISWEAAVEILSQSPPSPDNGFYRSKREQYGHHLYILACQKENSPRLFNIVRCGLLFPLLFLCM